MNVEPRPIITLFDGKLVITNTVTSTWAMMAIIMGVVWFLSRRYPTALEMLMDFVTDLVADVVGRETAHVYMPFLGTLAIFIAVGNSIGVVPGFVSPTRDINTPAALALVVFFAVHYFGVKAKGWLQYLKDGGSGDFLADSTLDTDPPGELEPVYRLAAGLHLRNIGDGVHWRWCGGQQLLVFGNS